jgi:hypothetical protein
MKMVEKWLGLELELELELEQELEQVLELKTLMLLMAWRKLMT